MTPLTNHRKSRDRIFLILCHVQKIERPLPTVQRIRSGRPGYVWGNDLTDHFILHLLGAILKKRTPADKPRFCSPRYFV